MDIFVTYERIKQKLALENQAAAENFRDTKLLTNPDPLYLYIYQYWIGDQQVPAAKHLILSLRSSATKGQMLPGVYI